MSSEKPREVWVLMRTDTFGGEVIRVYAGEDAKNQDQALLDKLVLNGTYECWKFPVFESAPDLKVEAVRVEKTEPQALERLPELSGEDIREAQRRLDSPAMMKQYSGLSLKSCQLVAAKLAIASLHLPEGYRTYLFEHLAALAEQCRTQEQ